MKALLFGCGSKWGLELTKELSLRNYEIDLFSSSEVNLPNVTTYKINWLDSNQNTIDQLLPIKKYDLIFFNQNSGGGPNEEDLSPQRDFPIEYWNMHLWINCQLPYMVVKKLSGVIEDTTKIGWMLTGLIKGDDPNLYKYAGYASIKSTNLHIMKGFSYHHPGIFFAINPFWFPISDYEKDAKKIANIIENIKQTDSGKSFDKDGKEWL